jgi:hypothetical protein
MGELRLLPRLPRQVVSNDFADEIVHVDVAFVRDPLQLAFMLKTPSLRLVPKE